MDKKKKENFKTIVLFCLMFTGINYYIYNYVIVPKAASVEIMKQTFIQEGRDSDDQILKNDEVAKLEDEIISLKDTVKPYNTIVLDGVDTINICHDFYTYLQEKNITGTLIRFTGLDENLEELTAENQLTAEEQAALLAGPPVDPSLNTDETIVLGPASPDPSEVIDEIPVVMDDQEKRLYKTVEIVLELEMDKGQYDTFLNDLDSITGQKIFVEKMTVEVVGATSESSVQISTLQGAIPSNPGAGLSSLVAAAVVPEVPSVAETPSALVEPLVEPTQPSFEAPILAPVDASVQTPTPSVQSPVNVAQPSVAVTKEHLKVTVTYVAYVKPDAVLSLQSESYLFYSPKEGVRDSADLFSSGWKKAEN